MVNQKSIEKEKQLKYAYSRLGNILYEIGLDKTVNEETKLLDELEEVSKEIGTCIQEYIDVRGIEEKPESDKLYVFRDSLITRIIFKSQIPERVSKQRSKLKHRDIRLKYLPQLNAYHKKQIEHGTNVMYKTRVVIVYNFIYSNEKQLKDYDNYETKVITDLVSSIFLVDDSPEYLSTYYRYEIRKDEDPHTEIYIIPEDKFSKYIKGGIVECLLS